VKLACEYSDCRDQLIWAADAYIRPETLARITDAYQRAADRGHLGGHGTTSSSDTQFFHSAKRGNAVNARYARDPGFSFYTYLSDQQGVPYSIKVMSATEAPNVLDGLLHHSTQYIGTHYTDTGGASDTYSSSARCSASVSTPGCAISPVSGIIKGSPTSCCPHRLSGNIMWDYKAFEA
jgi:TnpA family transposase